MRGFHSKDGLCFVRNEDASVTIEMVGIKIGDAEPPTQVLTTLTASVWASVVSSMSAAGESLETWQAALAAQEGQKS